MKKILICIWIDSHYVEMSRVARALVASGSYEPIFWFLDPYPTLERDIAQCEEEKWKYIIHKKKQGTGTKLFLHASNQMLRTLSSSIWHMISYFIRFFQSTFALQEMMRSYELHIRNINPSLILLPEENAYYDTGVIVKGAQKFDLPVIIIPFTINDATEAAEQLINYREFHIDANWLNGFIAKKFPKWVYFHGGQGLLRLQAGRIAAIEKKDLASPEPWIPNISPSTVIAVENAHMLEYYKRNLPNDRLVMTGSLADDSIYEVLHDKEKNLALLQDEILLAALKPILLVALPPSQFPRQCEFMDYESLLAFWMESLASVSGWNVVVRPHPRLTDGEINQLAKYEIKITTRDTASLIPLCDLYLASVSATIRWAIASGKPVINYDVYQMRYKDYEDVEAVLNVYDKKSFEKTLLRITSDHIFFKQLEAKQKVAAPQWGMLDGKSSERMLKLFAEVISKKSRRVEN